MLRHEQEQSASEGRSERKGWSWFRRREIVEQPAAQIEDGQVEADDLALRVAALDEAIHKRQGSVRTTYLGAGITVSGLASMFINLQLMGNAEHGSPALWIPFCLIFGGEALVLTGFLRGTAAVHAAVSALAGTDDLRAIGPLAEALAFGEPSYSLAVSALTRLLPRLQPSDAGLLTESHLTCLGRALKKSSSRLIFWRTNPHFAGILRRALSTLDAMHSTEPASHELIEPRPLDVEALLEQFQAAVGQRRKNTVGIGVAAAAGAISALANIATPILTHQPSSYALLGIAVASIGTTLVLSFRGAFRLKGMMNELVEAGDLQVVGPLVEIAAIQEGSANALAALMLTRLLPRIRASDAGLLTDGQSALLGRTLASNVNNAEFLAAMLKALEQVGDGKALPIVESLAAGRMRTAEPARVQAAAQECLPFLKVRFELQRASQSLLRASEISVTAPDTLLRPAGGAADMENASLLRPGAPQPESHFDETSYEFTALSNGSKIPGTALSAPGMA